MMINVADANIDLDQEIVFYTTPTSILGPDVNIEDEDVDEGPEESNEEDSIVDIEESEDRIDFAIVDEAEDNEINEEFDG